MKKEYLDCIALKRRIQGEIAAETKGMTASERLTYYQKQVTNSPFSALLEKQAASGQCRKARRMPSNT